LGGSPWRPRIGSTVNAPKSSLTLSRPVTVRIFCGSTDWVRSFSAVSGAPTMVAPVRMPTDAASDI
jgi:hypothetical protein